MQTNHSQNNDTRDEETRNQNSHVAVFSGLPLEMMVAIFHWMPDLELILAQVCWQWRQLILHKRLGLGAKAAVQLRLWCIYNKNDRLQKYAINHCPRPTMIQTWPWKSAAIMLNLCFIFVGKPFQDFETKWKLPGSPWKTIQKNHGLPDMAFQTDTYQARTYVMARAVIEAQNAPLLSLFFSKCQIEPIYIGWAIKKGYLRAAQWMITYQDPEALPETRRLYYMFAAAMHGHFTLLEWIHAPLRLETTVNKGLVQLCLWAIVHMDQDLWHCLIRLDPKHTQYFERTHPYLYKYFKEGPIKDMRRGLAVGIVYRNLWQTWDIYYYTMALQKEDPIQQLTWLQGWCKLSVASSEIIKDIALGTERLIKDQVSICIPRSSESVLLWLRQNLSSTS